MWSLQNILFVIFSVWFGYGRFIYFLGSLYRPDVVEENPASSSGAEDIDWILIQLDVKQLTS